MVLAQSRLVRRLACGVMLLPLCGCVIVSDLFAPGLLPVASTSQGVIIVAFNNTTRYPAEFIAYEAVDSSDLSRGARVFSLEVGSGEVGNEVLECPVEEISPGGLDESFGRTTNAVIVTTDEGQTQVQYTGPALESPDFGCGDVIEIRLNSAVTGGEDGGTEFSLLVRVIPG